jgi:hypothetical protein
MRLLRRWWSAAVGEEARTGSRVEGSCLGASSGLEERVKEWRQSAGCNPSRVSRGQRAGGKNNQHTSTLSDASVSKARIALL